MKKIIQPNSYIRSNTRDLANHITSGLTAYPKRYANPIEAIILNLGNGSTGIIFEDEGEYGMLETEDQAMYFSDLDEVVEFIENTWR